MIYTGSLVSPLKGDGTSQVDGTFEQLRKLLDLTGNGLGVLSEESGRHHPDRAITVVIDPVDGSTNASRGIPWFATSLCAVDTDGPLAALVINLASQDQDLPSVTCHV